MALGDLTSAFPFSGTGVVSVPAVLPGQRGIEQLNSYHCSATAQTVPIIPVNAVSPNLGYAPIAAIRVEPHVIPFVSQNKAPIDANSTLNRAAFWLTSVSNTGAGVDASPADVDWQIRATVGRCTPEVVAHGSLKGMVLNETNGLIAQVSGVLCTQFEIWMRIADVTAHSLRISLDIIADRFSGQRFEVVRGAITT